MCQARIPSFLFTQTIIPNPFSKLLPVPYIFVINITLFYYFQTIFLWIVFFCKIKAIINKKKESDLQMCVPVCKESWTNKDKGLDTNSQEILCIRRTLKQKQHSLQNHHPTQPHIPPILLLSSPSSSLT